MKRLYSWPIHSIVYHIYIIASIVFEKGLGASQSLSTMWKNVSKSINITSKDLWRHSKIFGTNKTNFKCKKKALQSVSLGLNSLNCIFYCIFLHIFLIHACYYLYIFYAYIFLNARVLLCNWKQNFMFKGKQWVY